MAILPSGANLTGWYYVLFVSESATHSRVTYCSASHIGDRIEHLMHVCTLAK